MFKLHLENLTTVAEDEPIPASDGRTYAQRVADFNAQMAQFGRGIATTLRERGMQVKDAATRREMLATAENIAWEAHDVLNAKL